MSIATSEQYWTSRLDGGDPEERAGIVSALLKKMEDLEGFPAFEGEIE